MPELQLPDGCELDEYDTDCSWEELDSMQRGRAAITKSCFEEGACFAFLDRNSLAHECNRRIFVLVPDDEHVLIFAEDGSRIDEPGQFVKDGRQELAGDEGFHQEWDQGYYEVSGQPHPQPQPAPQPASRTPQVAEDGNLIDEPGECEKDGRQELAADEGCYQDWDQGCHDLDGPQSQHQPTPQPAPRTPELDFSAWGASGRRIQECFKQSEAEADEGKWYGGIVGDRLPQPDNRYVFGFDDGDLMFVGEVAAKGLLEMGKLCACTVSGGLIADAPTELRAVSISLTKCGSVDAPIGVLMNDSLPVLEVAGVPAYHSHILSVEAITEALASKAARPKRGAAARADNEPERDGLRTIRRGDVLLYMGDAGGKQPEEVAFATLIHRHRGQYDRFIITYDESMEEFCVNTMVSWRRVPASMPCTGFDPDNSDNIKVVSDASMEAMMLAWDKDTEVCACSLRARIPLHRPAFCTCGPALHTPRTFLSAGAHDRHMGQAEKAHATRAGAGSAGKG